MTVYDVNKATSAADAEQIVPRAEFRVFGQNIIDIVKPAMWKAHATLFKVRQSGETYILSRHTNEANVKIRNGLLDIKIKVGETQSGYDIFQPRGKFQFPVKQDELAAILEKLRSKIEFNQDSYTFDNFLKLIRTTDDIASVDVHKQRHVFSVDGVICEYGKILFNGAMVETTCVESEDYAAMEKVIDKLEISDFENVNYLKAAKRVVGMEE
ncbi:MAG: hypothetical protein U9P36_06690 [Thermodesulfobacteriota bacterium]|nr:hypothetical protein [Thermodesulfobacteriota bacterium]